MEHNCAIIDDKKAFRYRAAAIIIEDGCVLFARNEVDDYYYSVGGAVHMGETSEDAVKREVFEETGVQYEVDHLAVIHENFFIGSSDLNGVDFHEVTFYYMMKPMGKRDFKSQSTTMAGVKEAMHWVPIDELDKCKSYPTFMKGFLMSEHNGVEHIITDERVNETG
ncbi:NUDIX hydrolase [Lagierella massiliensis]|uniref:NUDIX hydrolase n=1 Tax=Lagierella massiliensis TaxID=1689303 RepID=UPI0006D7DD65|nr:NUDIX hydrolase [Lagierella massiliensis]